MDDGIYLFTLPIQFYCRFLTKELIELILSETNQYGRIKYSTWAELTEEEFLKYLAICLHMEIEKRPNLKDYWSTKIVFSTSFAAKYISRNRFIEITNSFHFVNNEKPDRSNRLYKIDSVVKILNRTFAEVYTPSENIYIDESMVPFQGRIIFRQYISGKRHKYGVKLYKLCSEGGYTYNFIIYTGKDLNRQ